MKKTAYLSQEIIYAIDVPNLQPAKRRGSAERAEAEEQALRLAIEARLPTGASLKNMLEAFDGRARVVKWGRPEFVRLD